MMISGTDLSLLVSEWLPKVYEEVEWGDIWQRPLQEGSAFQWTCFAALVYQFERIGWTATHPLLEYPNSKETFVLRNQLPRQFGSQPGHSSLSDLPLSIRTQQSFIPRAILEKEGRAYSIFLEGVPYHLLSLPQPKYYAQRPDIVLLSGKPILESSTIVDDQFVDYAFDLGAPENQQISGRLRLVNRPDPSLSYRSPNEGLRIPLSGIIECSVNKTAAKAQRQLDVYQTLFSSSSTEVPSLLIAGNLVHLSRYPSAHIPLDKDIDIIRQSFLNAAATALTTFGIL